MVEYNSAVYTLVHRGTPDPWIVAAHGRCYMTFTCNDRIEIWSAASLADLRVKREARCIYKPPPGTDHSDSLWAPELHRVHGRWYVYFAAAHPARGNRSHRMWVLAGPSGDRDPTLGPWEFVGPILGMPQDQWAIDGTVFELQDRLYFAYSGWPFGVHYSEALQHLFVMRLASATEAASAPVEICRPTHDWEFTIDGGGIHGINEGPQFLEAPNGSWRGLIYSCAGSWTKDYKMAVLNFQGGEPLNPQSWRKSTQPLIQTDPGMTGPFGPGHGCFIHFGSETCCVYHATDRPNDGWSNRKPRCQRVIFTQHGPSMGGYCGIMTSDFDLFSKGQPPPEPDRLQGDGQLHALFTKARNKCSDFVARNA